MRIELQDGGRFEGQNEEELVHKIWHSAKFDTSETVEEYMRGFAKRSLQWDGQELDTSSCLAFFNSLVKVGFARVTA